MKIERVETFLVDAFLLVRVTADDGTQGIGEGTYWAFPRATEETVRSMASDLVGMDAGNIEHIWNWLYRKQSFRGPNLAAAISAIDIALWDIKGKRLGAPVWDLLGGKVRERVRAIALGVSG
ncbi:MAG: galactokinase, partial [Gemmatimonadetes bacterium]|nr:galactokinase [Gemmatimonadota bacterium]